MSCGEGVVENHVCIVGTRRERVTHNIYVCDHNMYPQHISLYVCIHCGYNIVEDNVYIVEDKVCVVEDNVYIVGDMLWGMCCGRKYISCGGGIVGNHVYIVGT